MSFLEYLEKTCPGDDAHDGFGDRRPLLERCGMCREIYEEHQKEVSKERDRILSIVNEEATHYSVAPMNPASPREIALVFANAVRSKAAVSR